MKRINSKLFLCILSIQTSLHVFAQNDADTIGAKHTLDEVMVTGSRINLPITQTVKQVTVISRSEIEHAPIQSIQDILNYVAGVDILQRGGHGVVRHVSERAF